MTYTEWYNEHAKKHAAIMKKLEGLDKDTIVEYFMFENMVEKEPDFCRLYKDNRKCHDMEDLNCYLCGCSNFRLTDTKSYCDINSKYGGVVEGKDGFIHQNCSGCTIPHRESFIKKVFNKDWKIMMKDVL